MGGYYVPYDNYLVPVPYLNSMIQIKFKKNTNTNKYVDFVSCDNSLVAVQSSVPPNSSQLASTLLLLALAIIVTAWHRNYALLIQIHTQKWTQAFSISSLVFSIFATSSLCKMIVTSCWYSFVPPHLYNEYNLLCFGDNAIHSKLHCLLSL